MKAIFASPSLGFCYHALSSKNIELGLQQAKEPDSLRREQIIQYVFSPTSCLKLGFNNIPPSGAVYITLFSLFIKTISTFIYEIKKIN
jgi:hypothetical protein